MPKYSVSLEDIKPYELVDASATVMKEPHKEFGNWMKKLATIVKDIGKPEKGHWQPYWTIATRVFGLVYKGGHSEEVAVSVAVAIAGEFGIDAGKAEELARYISQNVQAIIGKKARAGAAETIV
jgi:hypothetical protein